VWGHDDPFHAQGRTAGADFESGPLLRRSTTETLRQALSLHGRRVGRHPPSRAWRRPTTRMPTLIRTSSSLFPPVGRRVLRPLTLECPRAPRAASISGAH
jgi:hypothetical protein